MRRPLATASLVAATFTVGAVPEPDEITVDLAWAGHPVGFALHTAPPDQFVAYYDADRLMTVAQRRIGETNWTRVRLDSRVGWDSHNYIAITLDRAGRLHLAGNMHASPLVYFRSRAPRDVSVIERMPAMVGDRESQMTYPVFFRDAEERLLFRYRDGRSGKGDDLINLWDEDAQRWRRWLDVPLFSGEGCRNAYASVPTLGPDGHFHIVWVWRNTPDCATSHSPGYARSRDVRQWEDAFGRPLALPITLERGGTIDPVPPGGGVINGNVCLGFDSSARPVVTYHKYDANGDLQIYAARPESNRWAIVQVSDWTGYRWTFGGGGSIPFEVRVFPVERASPGRLRLRWRSGLGSGVWWLDETSLVALPFRPEPTSPPCRSRGAAPLAPERPELELQTAADSGAAAEGWQYVLLWEALGVHRDRPRDPPWPAPSRLRVRRLPRR